MIGIIEICLVLGVVLLLWKVSRKPANLPPGPYGLPGIGSTSILRDGKEFEQRLFDYRKQYGDLFIWKVGNYNILVVFDFSVMKETLAKPEFAGRPPMALIRFMGKGKNTGLISSSGEVWKEGRRFFIRQMRDQGFANTTRMAPVVQHEAMCVVDEMKQTAGKPAVLANSIQTGVLNVVWQVMAGTRYEVNDPKLLAIHKLFNIFQDQVMNYAILDFYYWLTYLLPSFILKKITKEDKLNDMRKMFKDFVEEIIKNHEKDFDEDNPRDYLDAFMAEMKRNPSETFCRENLVSSTFDLLDAGSFTITSTLHWTMLYLASYPEIQKKIQENVDEELPGKALPTLDDRSRLSYVEAVLEEIHRHASMGSTGGLMRYSEADTTVSGYFIPKGTILMVMAGAAHYDAKYWNNPEVFDPQRFLDDKGKIVNKQYALLPFGLGKRQCPGENLARMELLIFLCALVHNFNFLPPPGETVDLKPLPNNPFGRFPNMRQEILVTLR